MEAIEKKITKIIPDNLKLPVRELDGRLIISKATDVFGWVDSNFRKLGLDKPSRPTKKVNALVSEIIGDGTFIRIFTDINPNLEKSVMTLSQIIEFCKNYPSWLKQRGETLFLTEKKRSIFQKIWNFILRRKLRKYFVVHVHVFSDGLDAYVHLLEDGYVWRGECRYCVVSPQLIPSVA
ncbi:MAG: hypothetical protein WC458_04100 [Patescibacteria group bacterium]